MSAAEASQLASSGKAPELPPGLGQVVVLLIKADRLSFERGLQNRKPSPFSLPVPLLLPQLLAPQLPHNFRAAPRRQPVSDPPSQLFCDRAVPVYCVL